jgi:WD40 repeat protein
VQHSARQGVRSGSVCARQQGYSSLLGTLRGHSDTVTSLLRWDGDAGSGTASSAGVSTASSVCGLLSGGKDSRVKLWDVAEGRNTCDNVAHAATGVYQQACADTIKCTCMLVACMAVSARLVWLR